jgi:tetratricopeptide (TPR) repeat protein
MRIRNAACVCLLMIVLALGLCLGQSKGLGLMEFSLPEKNWALEMNLKGFELDQVSFRDDFSGRSLQASRKDQGLVISAFLVPAREKWTSVMYRDNTWEILSKRFDYEQVRKWERDGWALVEGLNRNVEGIKNINQMHIFGYVTREDAWIDIHISKALFKPEDEVLFRALLDTIRVVDYQQTIRDNFFYGTVAYNKNNYPLAIRYYEMALEAEKIKSELQKELWYALVDNLTMAYGLSGNLQKARATADYGLTKDPEYPLFYYNQACTSAEEGDLESALRHLEGAFKYKTNMLKGEKFPDPAKDNSFKKFLNDKRFKTFLKTHK